MQKRNKIKHLFIPLYLRNEAVTVGGGNILPDFQNVAKMHILVIFFFKQNFSWGYLLVKHPV